MRKTLLTLVQDILVEINGDEVNSINDTLEAEEVAKHIQASYRNLIAENVWPHTRRAITLEARSDSNFPTHMIVADDLKELLTNSVRYNVIKSGETRKKYQPVAYLDPDHFLNKINARDNDSDNIDVIIDDSGIELLINNSKAPEYYTSFDDVNLIFDSYDSEVDSTLQKSKFQAQGYIFPEFTITDSFTPDLPPDAFPLLHEKATTRCNFKMRQMSDVVAASESQKQSRVMSRRNWVVAGGIKYPNYGRKR
jgi:hypothetical protein